MDITTLAMIARMMERSLIVIGGITAIYLGYKLFVLGIEQTQGEASAFGIELKNFGPGLFFAALGAIILVATMRASIKVGPADIVDNKNSSHELVDKSNKPATNSNAVFFGMEDIARKNNEWTNTSFFLDVRQLLRRLLDSEPIDDLADLSNSLLSRLDSITMNENEYKRYQELTSKIPLNEAEQTELVHLEDKLFPYDNGKK